MEVYNSEQDQVEALKAWWDKNGKLVMVGIIALLLAVFGWRSWQERQLAIADAASLAYFQLQETAENDPQAASEIGRHIVGEFSATVYAPMASLMLARLAVEQDDLAAAEAHLQTVVAQPRLPELQAVARLRLAQLLLSQQRHDEALAQLAALDDKFAAAASELRGDILVAQGDVLQAAQAYRQALVAMGAQGSRAALVEMKLADLPGGTE